MFRKLFVVVLVVLVFATAAYIFAYANTEPVRQGASGTGFAVSNIIYAFDTASPANITTVAFDLDNPAATVKVSMTGGTLQDCTSATPFTHWTCNLTGVNVADVTALRIVATK